ncbi:hypothetical protein JGH11_13425 [Dysgonomonas sp. Marseille-P4677]|uniref:amylo-alpha-1,6-glucosidase n=1 Tax=Dysgonomonas sp. Marseille-P4677 TaxID=2364790 RepID=UPI0019139627|nr:trehalase family glycosidase [Dysgonomonas sp. Marseille-P4677]MBK5721875.1 hypothetical protein [Dysgonomonas sp. Marseille-P4677]
MRNILFCIIFFGLVGLPLLAQESTRDLVDESRIDKRHWQYFGWEEDHPKAISLMGGGVYPRRPRLDKNDDHSWEFSRKAWHKNSADPVFFLLSVDGSEPYYPDETSPFRRKIIHWSLAENYLPFPVSVWEKDGIEIKITHVGKRLLNHSVNAVYTQVKLTNTSETAHKTQLIINGNKVQERVFSLQSANLQKRDANQVFLSTDISAGESVVYEFVLPANGEGNIQSILDEGGFDKQYTSEKEIIDRRLEQFTHPVSLPYEELINLWKTSQMNMWNATVKTPVDYEQRGSGGNVYGFYQYDRVFDHDVPDMAIQYIIEGNWDVARQIMNGATYERLSKGLLEKEKYNDAIPKYLITMAQYLQVTGDKAFFTKKLIEKLKRCARAVQDMRKDQLSPDLEEKRAYGLILKGSTLDNGSEYLIVDNFAALHGLAAYIYICNQLGQVTEAKWAQTEMEDLNNCLNKSLDISMEESGTDWYNACFSFDYDSVLVSGPGNWFGTTLMMPTFPWNAYLKGFDLGGTWKNHFDPSVERWLEETRNFGCEPGSFGAWWGAKYGSIYNPGMAMPLLISDKHRTLVAQSIEWLLDNQSSPYHWGESFHKPQPASDWTRPEVDLETWGLGFIRQAMLQLCISVHVDGTIILGRGIPDKWLESGKPITWKNVYINNGKKFDFSIRKDKEMIYINISGDDSDGKIIVDLPMFKGKKIEKPGNTKEIVIDLKKHLAEENLQFDISKMPFSRFNSYLGISARNEEGRIYLHCARRLFGEDKVFELKFFQEDKVVNPEIIFKPYCLQFKKGLSVATLYLKGENSLIIDSHGLDIKMEQFELPRKNGDTPEEYPLAYGTNIGNNHFKIISVNARFYTDIHLFNGSGEFHGPIRKNERGGEIDQKIHLMLKTDKDKKILSEVHIAPFERHKNSFKVPNVKKDISEIKANWEEVLEKRPNAPDKYRTSAIRSWYNLWSSTVPAGGNYKHPTVVMSMEFMSSVWSWDHCFNALSTSLYDVQHGLNQFFLPFEVQSSTGVLPDYVNPDLEIVWGVTKPPIHGWCFAKLMEQNSLNKEVLKKAYRHLELWTKWWLDYNDSDSDGIPDYPMGCDSGWDNATVFDLGYFVESPDLCAFLILQMNTLSKIATKLGDQENSNKWAEKSVSLYEKWINHSWTKNGFVAKISHTDQYDIDPTSLITLVPLVLGDKLEPAKRDLMITRLKKHFLTDYGLATEKYKGPYYKADNYWRGAIWAPSTYLIIDGLLKAGEKELATEIARRFCDMIASDADGDFENFDALTGKGLRASGYTWTSSVNILLLKLLSEL